MSDHHTPNVLGSHVAAAVTETRTPDPAAFAPEYPPGEPRCRTRAHDCTNTFSDARVLQHQHEHLAEEARRLRERVTAMEAVLRAVEWNAVDGEDAKALCPFCFHGETGGHATDCALDAILHG